MANIVPLVVSGEITSSQICLLMSIVGNTPYYLVHDVAGIPYFQPLFQDPSSGLDVFTASASRVLVTIGPRASAQISAVITDVSVAPFAGRYLTNTTINRVIAPNSSSAGLPQIPIEAVGYQNPNLVACGFAYTLANNVTFFLSTNWYPNPEAQSIGAISSPTESANSFFVFPISGLINSLGLPATSSVFKVIYDDVLGKTVDEFLFTSFAAYQAGAGSPYQYCAVGGCGPNCYGTCGTTGKYDSCNRMKDQTFECSINVTWKCKILASLWFLVPVVFGNLLFWSIFFYDRYERKKSLPIIRPMSRGVKITLCVIGVAMALVLMILMIVGLSNTNLVNRWYCFSCGRCAVNREVIDA